MSDATEQAPTLPATTSSSARVGPYAWYVFWVMCGINFLNYTDRWVASGLSDTLKSVFHLSDFSVGELSSAFLIVYTLVAFPLGFLADRLSRKVVVGVGVALWSAATVLTGISTSFATLFLARTLVGVGEGSYYPAGTPLLAAWFPPHRRSSVLAQWGASALVGAGVGFLLASAFVSPTRWRMAFFICGVPGLVLALLMLLSRSRARHELDPETDVAAERASPWQVIKTCLRIPTVRVILALHALGFFPLTAVTTFLVIYLSATYGPKSPYGAAGLSASLVALLPGVLLVLGGISGGIYGGAWANRLRHKYVGARVRVGGLGFLYSMPFLLVTLVAPYVLRAIPTYTALSNHMQVVIGVVIFSLMGLGAAFFINVYNGPTSAALQDVLPPSLRAAGGGLELTLAHVFGDSYAAALVGLISVGLSQALGGEQIGLALLLTCPITLVAAGIVGIWGSRFYKRDVEALGVSAEHMVGA